VQEGAGDEYVSPDGIATEEPRGALGSSGDDDVVANNQGSPRVSSPPPPPPPPLSDTSIPYSFKDIPLPKRFEPDSVRCVLGEDVVVLFEFAGGSPEQPGQRIDRMFYHPI